MESTHSGVRTKIAAVENETKGWIYERLTCCASVLYGLIANGVCQERLIRKVRLEHLVERLVSEKGWLNQKLRDVWSLDIAVTHKHLPAKKILGCDWTRKLSIQGAVDERPRIQVRDRLTRSQVTRLLREWHFSHH